MEQASFVLRRPLFFLLTGALIVLSAASGFLYQQKRMLQQETRQLIIQNDSVMSVNIILTDSLRRQASFAAPKNAALVLKSNLK